MDMLIKLQNWYFKHCDGRWEHDYGIKIHTFDNPGWSFEVNLNGTKNVKVSFKKIEIERSEYDWIQCWIENNIFKAACGPLNLEEVLKIFLEWTK